MIVFDVDGTLIGGESADWKSFQDAFHEAAGFRLDGAFFDRISEVTAKAIVHKALEGATEGRKRDVEHSVCEGYLRRLKLARSGNPSVFSAAKGAAALLEEVRSRGIPVAIATGDWRATIEFKLDAAGLDVGGIPIVTSSEFYGRAEIIEEAVMRCGRPLGEAVYVGDGLWDLRACRKLGIPFIGVGRRSEALRKAGAVDPLSDLTPIPFWQRWKAIEWPKSRPEAWGSLGDPSRRDGGPTALGRVTPV